MSYSDMIGVITITAAIICVIIALPLSIGLMRRMNRSDARPALPAGDIAARLERMEQGMEAIATEVERISEGQRFTTKMLSSRADSNERIAPSTT